jgi:geranylgeranyl diphosphate synthase type I
MPKTKTDLALRVDAELLAFIASERDALEPEAQPLLDELESLIGSGGKRLRPRFAYWGFRAAGGIDGTEILRVGAALEMLHTMAMITDDVMDRSAQRRNRATTASTFGPSAAILVGMLGFVLADRLFVLAREALGGSPAAAERYDRLRTRAIAGQYLDLQSARLGHADEETTRRLASLKSGSYTVADPLAIGALLAGASDATVEALETFGQPLGEAFQIRDDVLGTFGDPAMTGKDGDGDIREGKQTVLLAKARANSSANQIEVLSAHVGDPSLTAADAERVREVIVATGALEDTNRLVDELTSRAIAALDDAPIAVEAQLALLALADEATTRHA